ncbi:unnamed protein product [Lasius platythorax]|uniref:Uncharacterized protein n=1 Tax=Lasius platythorax TaxID=488582 RepID=A0AAV2NXN4_9HYME
MNSASQIYFTNVRFRFAGANWKGEDNGDPSARLKDHYGQSRIGDPNADRTRNPRRSRGTKQKVIADRGFLVNSNE